MKTGWQTFRLDELTEADSPITYGVVKPGDPGDVLFIRGGDLADGRVLSNQLRTITRAVSEQYSRTLLRGGELLMCLVGQPGQVAVAPLVLAGANIARQVGLIRLRSEIEAEFISYFLQSPDGQASLGTHTGGSVQQVINLGDLRTVNVPVPPLAEQRRIVGILDEAFEGLATAKANAEQNLQNARALFESHLQAVFTQRSDEAWSEKRLDEIAEFSQGVQIGLEAQSTKPGDGLVRFIRIIDYTQGTDDIRYVKDPGARFWVEQSDIVMVRYGTPGLIGRGIEGVIANNLFQISPIEATVTNDFLAYFLGQQRVQDYLRCQGSSTMPALTFKQLGAVGIAFPPSLEEQDSIAALLDSLREETQRLESLYQRKLAALDELKKSLLHRAFSGQL